MRGGVIRVDSSIMGESKSHRAGPLSSGSIDWKNGVFTDCIKGRSSSPFTGNRGNIADGDVSDDRR